MGRLQSGLLLLETPRGLVHVELSFKERVALLWTFRNFRRLSTPLLNSRENTLVNILYRNHAGVISPSYDPSIVIGVVEDFVPSMEIGATEIVPEKIVAQKIVAPLTPRKERQQRMVAERAEIAQNPRPNSRPASSSSRVAWSTVAMARLATTRLAVAKLVTARLATFKLAMSRRVTSRLATTMGALSLCIVSVVAWHRIEAVPGSQAHNRPQLEQVGSIMLASAPIAEPVAVAAAPSTPATAPVTAPDAAVKPTPLSAAIPAAAVPAAAPPTIVPGPKQTTRVHSVSTRTLPLSGEESGIQATRPPLRYVYPDYSDVHARGVVALTAELDSDGKVRTVKVVTGNRALAAAAVRAVRQWRYRPYLKDGQPVATESNVQISFISSDAISMTFPPSIPARR